MQNIYDLNTDNLDTFLYENPVSMLVFLTGDEFDSEIIFEKLTEAAENCRMAMGFGIVSTVDPDNLSICRINGVTLAPMARYFVDGVRAGFDRIGAPEILRGLTSQAIDRDFMSLIRSSDRSFRLG